MNQLQETKNKHLIYTMIKNHFSLKSDSLKEFKNALFFNQVNKPKEYNFIDAQPDKRIHIPLDTFIADISESSDVQNLFPGFVDFKNNHNWILKTNNINLTLKNYFDNKVEFEKNNFKLFKLVFRLELIKILNETVDIATPHGLTYKDNMSKFDKFIETYIGTHPCDQYLFERRINLLNFNMNQAMINKQSNKSTMITISRNFTDFFLCSTNQPFSSCLNLDSDYDGAYWSALPSLLLDPNRALIYVSDPTRNAIFHGIVGPKMITRSWLLLTRIHSCNNIKHTLGINIVRSYPNDSYSNLFQQVVEKMFNPSEVVIGSFNASSERIMFSKYKLRLIKTDENVSYTIYQDTTRLEDVSERKKSKDLIFSYAFSSSRNFEYYKEYGDRVQNCYYQYDGGLSYLIQNNIKLSKRLRHDDEENEDDDNCYCDDCNESGAEYYSSIDRNLCESCFNDDYSTCNHCSDTIANDDAVWIESTETTVCNSCYDRYYAQCPECNEYIKKSDSIMIGNNHYCEDCHNSLFTTCITCDDTIRIYNAIENDENYYCNDCYEKQFTQCEVCNEAIDKNLIIQTETGELICTSCKYGINNPDLPFVTEPEQIIQEGTTI